MVETGALFRASGNVFYGIFLKVFSVSGSTQDASLHLKRGDNGVKMNKSVSPPYFCELPLRLFPP